MSSAKLLFQLRKYANRKTFYKCEDMVRDLLPYISPQQAVELAFNQVHPYLPVWQQYNPQNDSVREIIALLQVKNNLNIGRIFYLKVGEKYLGPAWAGFCHALDYACSALDTVDDPELCYSWAGDSIAWALGTRTYAYWAQKFPADWKIEEAFDVLDEETQQRIEKRELPWPSTKTWITHPVVQNYEKKMWFEVAKQIEDWIKEAAPQ